MEIDSSREAFGFATDVVVSIIKGFTIVTNNTNNKHVKGDERVSHDVLQNSYDEHVDNSTPFYF